MQFQRATTTLDSYTMELKARVQLCEILVLRVGSTEAAAKFLSEEDGIDMSNTSNFNTQKYYIDKSEVQFQAAMHFNGINNVIYKGLKDEVKNNWSVQGYNNFPKTISDTINKADNFIDPKTGVKASNSQCLDFMQQGEESRDKIGKGRGNPVCGQGGWGQILQLNNMLVGMMIAEIQTRLLKMVYTVVVRQIISYTFLQTSTRSRDQRSISR